MTHFSRNLVLLVFVAIAAGILFGYGCPWLDAIGHKGLCYVFFAILIVVLLYARSGSSAKRRTEE